MLSDKHNSLPYFNVKTFFFYFMNIFFLVKITDLVSLILID